MDRRCLLLAMSNGDAKTFCVQMFAPGDVLRPVLADQQKFSAFLKQRCPDLNFGTQ